MTLQIRLKKLFFLSLIVIQVDLFCIGTDYCRLSNNIVEEVANSFKSQEVILYGYGGSMMDDIQSVHVRHLTYGDFNIDLARKLFVNMAEAYLTQYNLSKEIRPFLHNYPLTIENIKITLSFENKDHQKLKEGAVAYIMVGKDNHIFYAGFDDKTHDYYTLHKEPYDKAVEIVKNTGCHVQQIHN